MKLNEITKVDDSLPTTKFSNKELETAAKKAGHSLFDKHRSGLLWGGNTKVEKTNTYRILKELVENVGEDAGMFEFFGAGDFEFVFMPSTGKGVDSSGRMHNFVTDAHKMADKDGNIYLCDNTDETLIRVVKPVIKSKKQFDELLKQLLDAQGSK